jgi:hypothetical protein
MATGVGAGIGWAVDALLEEVVDLQPVDKIRVSAAAKRTTGQRAKFFEFFIFAY